MSTQVNFRELYRSEENKSSANLLPLMKSPSNLNFQVNSPVT